MKKENTTKEVKEVKEAKEVKVRAKRKLPEEQKLMNEFFKTMRKNAAYFIKLVATSPEKDMWIGKLDSACKIFNNMITSMHTEMILADRVARMTDAEKEYLKALLAKEA